MRYFRSLLLSVFFLSLLLGKVEAAAPTVSLEVSPNPVANTGTLRVRVLNFPNTGSYEYRIEIGDPDDGNDNEFGKMIIPINNGVCGTIEITDDNPDIFASTPSCKTSVTNAKYIEVNLNMSSLPFNDWVEQKKDYAVRVKADGSPGNEIQQRNFTIIAQPRLKGVLNFENPNLGDNNVTFALSNIPPAAGIYTISLKRNDGTGDSFTSTAQVNPDGTCTASPTTPIKTTCAMNNNFKTISLSFVIDTNSIGYDTAKTKIDYTLTVTEPKLPGGKLSIGFPVNYNGLIFTINPNPATDANAVTMTIKGCAEGDTSVHFEWEKIGGNGPDECDVDLVNGEGKCVKADPEEDPNANDTQGFSEGGYNVTATCKESGKKAGPVFLNITGVVPSLPPTDPPPCASKGDIGGEPTAGEDPADPAIANFSCEAFNTPLGIIPTDPQGLVQRVFGFLLSISGGIVLLLIIRSGYQMMASQGNAEKVKEAREQLTAAIVGLLFIVFSFVILQIIGFDILRIPGFGQ